MQLTIKTTILQAMFNKAVKGASQNKIMPLTNWVQLEKVGNKLILTTIYNMESYLYVIANNVEGDEFYVTTEVTQLHKLISKMTCENITLKLENKVLEVIGNGRYSIEVRLDDEGEIVKFPNPYRDIHPEDTEEIEFTDVIEYSDITKVVNTVKTSLAVTLESPVLMNYYVGDFVCATDTTNMTSYNKKLVESKELLIPAEVMELMTLLTEEKINAKITDEYMLFVTDETILYSQVLPDPIEDYPAEVISNYIQQQFKYKCVVNKNKLLALLDRLSLFVSPYDDYVIRFKFGAKELSVSTVNSGSDEVLEYEEVGKKNKDCEYPVDIRAFTEHLKTCIGEKVELQYGDDTSIKIVDGDVVKLVCLFEDEEE